MGTKDSTGIRGILQAGFAGLDGHVRQASRFVPRQTTSGVSIKIGEVSGEGQDQNDECSNHNATTDCIKPPVQIIIIPRL